MHFHFSDTTLKLAISAPLFSLWNPESGIWNTKSGIRNPESGIRNPESEIRNKLVSRDNNGHGSNKYIGSKIRFIEARSEEEARAERRKQPSRCTCPDKKSRWAAHVLMTSSPYLFKAPLARRQQNSHNEFSA